jgi:8-oxo-dGTP diphosphatase
MIEVACGIMYNDENKILLGLIPMNKIYGGYWEFPGGKREENESIKDCLKREWLEELNLDIEIYKEIYQHQCDKFLCRFFTGRITDLEYFKSNIHDQVSFYNVDEIRSLKLLENDIDVLSVL